MLAREVILKKLPTASHQSVQKLSGYWVGAFLSAAIGVVYIFREFFFHGFLAGDLGDGRAIVSYTNHWYHFLNGEIGLRNYSFFWPAKDTLGGTDPLLIQGIITAFLRWVGFTAVSSSEWSFILITLIGLLGAFAFSRNFLKRDTSSFIFTILIATSYGLNAQLGHPQLLAFTIIFWVLHFATKVQKANSATQKLNCGLAVIAILSLLASTSWYGFQFFLILTLIFFVITQRGSSRKEIKRKIIDLLCIFRVKPNLLSIFLYFMSCGAILVWIYIYLPFLKSGTTSWSWPEVSFYGQRPMDLINTSVGAFYPITVFDNYLSLDVNPTFERAMGFNLILLLVFTYVIVDFRYRFPSFKFSFASRLILTAIMAECVITFTNSGKSLWWFFWKFFPGAGSLRAIDRMNILIVWIALFVVVLYFDKFTYKNGREIFVIFVLLVFYFSFNVRNSQSFWKEGDYLPNNFKVKEQILFGHHCKGFFLYQDPKSPQNSYIQFEAMAISEVTGIPTINGSSGKFPPKWVFTGMQKPSDKEIKSWLGNFGATPLSSEVCLLVD
jgi:hypothetical protein